MFYHKKSNGNKQKSALLESERLRKDIQDLEDALILHSRFQSDSDNSIRGMIRKEIGTSYWEHGGDGKLRTYRSERDLHRQRTRKHDLGYNKATAIKKQHTISHITDLEANRPVGDKENMDAIIDPSANKKQKMFKNSKSSGMKSAPKDITSDKGSKSELAITNFTDVPSSTGPVRITNPKEGNMDTRMKTADLEDDCFYDRIERSHANKNSHSIQGDICSKTDKTNNKSLHTVPDFLKIVHNDKLKAGELVETSAKSDLQKMSSLPTEEALNGASLIYTSPFSNTDTHKLTIEGKPNTPGVDGSSDAVKSSFLDYANPSNKSGISTSAGGLLYNKYGCSKSKDVTAYLFDASFSNEKNEAEYEKKCVLPYQSQISENRNKWAKSSKISFYRDCDSITTDQIHFLAGDSNSYNSNGSVILKKPHRSISSERMVPPCDEESLQNNERQREQLVESIHMKEYPHIFNPARASSVSVIASKSSQTNTVATYVKKCSPKKKSLASQQFKHGKRLHVNSTQSSSSLSPAAISGIHLCTQTSHFKIDKTPSNKPPPLFSYSMFSSNELLKETTDEINMMDNTDVLSTVSEPHSDVLSTVSEPHSISSLHHLFAGKLSKHIDSALMNDAGTSHDSEVEDWLHELGLQPVDQFVKIFRDHQMNMLKVQLLTASDLRKMGINDLGPIMRIMKGVQILGREEVSLQQQTSFLGQDKVSFLQDDMESNSEECITNVMNKCNETNTPSMNVSSTQLHLGLRNGSEGYNVNSKILEDTDETVQCKTSPSLFLHAQKGQDSILGSLDINSRSKSDLDNMSRFQNESSVIHTKIQKDNLPTGGMKEYFKCKQSARKKPVSVLVHWKQSRPTVSGKPPASSKTVEKTSDAAQKIQLKKQQEYLEVDADARTIDKDKKQMREEMPARHVRKTLSNHDRNKGQRSRLERTASASSTKAKVDESKREHSLSAGFENVLSTKGFIVPPEYKGNAIPHKKINEKQPPKEGISQTDSINIALLATKLCKDKERFGNSDLDLTLGTVKKLQKHLSHLEDKLVQQNNEKLQQGSHEQEGSLESFKDFCLVDLSQQPHFHSDEESSPHQSAGRSARDIRRQRAAMGFNLPNEPEELASPATIAVCKDIHNKIFKPNNGQMESMHKPFNPGKYNMGKFVNETMLNKFLNKFGADPSQNACGGLLGNLARTDDTSGGYVIDAGNPSTILEDTATIKSAKHTSPTKTLLKQKEFHPGPLRNKDKSHIRGLQQRLAERTDMGHNSILDNIKKVELNRGDIIFSEKDRLGRGTFAEVFKGTYQGSEVAVKRLRTPLHTGDINYFVAEVSLLQELRHPHVVMMLGVCSSADKLPLIVMEFLACGNLQSWLHDSNRPSLNQGDFYQITHDIAAGMLYLHSHQPPVFHLDLKPKNILIGHGTRAKVADFGFSKLKHEASVIQCQLSKTQAVRDKPAWVAPELLTSHGEITSKADVYSFGMILWEMMTKQIPYKDCSVFQVLENVRFNNLPTIPTDCPKGLSHLVERCWDQNPAARPRFKEVLRCLEQLSESGEWRTSKEVTPVHEDQVFSLNLNETKSASMEEHSQKSVKTKTYCASQIDLISLTSQDDKNDDSCNEREYGILDDQSEYFQDSAGDLFSFTDRTSWDKKLNAKKDRIFSPSADKSEFVSHIFSSRNVLNSLEIENNSREEKNETDLWLSGSYFPSRKLHPSTSRSQSSMEINPTFEKLLPLRHSLDGFKTASLRNNNFKSQSFIGNCAEKHTNCKRMDGTFPDKTCKSVTISNDSSAVCYNKSTKQQETVNMVRKSSSETNVNTMCSSTKLYVPSFYEMGSQTKLRNNHLRSGLITDSSLGGAKNAESGDCNTDSHCCKSVSNIDSLCCKSVHMQPASSFRKSLNKAYDDFGLDVCKRLFTNNEVSNVTTGHGELVVSSNESDIFVNKNAQNLVSLQSLEQNASLIENTSEICINTYQSETDKNQLHKNKVRKEKEKSLDAGTASLQLFTEQCQPLHNTEANTSQNMARDSIYIQHIKNVTDCKKKEPTNNIPGTQNFNLVNEYSSGSSNDESVVATMTSQLSNKHISVISLQEACPSTTMINLTSKINAETLSSSFNEVEILQKMDDICAALSNDSKPFFEPQTLTQEESDSESSATPDDISEDSLSREENTTFSKVVDNPPKQSNFDPLTRNFSKQLVPTDKVLGNNKHEPFMVLELNDYVSDCVNKTEGFVLSDISPNTGKKPFRKSFISHNKDCSPEQMHSDFKKLEQKDRSGVSELPSDVKYAVTNKSQKITSVFCDHLDRKLWPEVSTVNPSSCELIQPCFTTTQQEILGKSKLLSEDKEQKKMQTLEDTLIQNVSKQASNEAQHSAVTSPLLSSNHRHSGDRYSTSKMKSVPRTSDTTYLFTQEKKMLKPKVHCTFDNQQMLKGHEDRTCFSLNSSMLRAQKKLLRSVATTEPSSHVIKESEAKESSPTVISILKKAMADRRFAMHDAQESQDMNSDPSWSIQD